MRLAVAPEAHLEEKKRREKKRETGRKKRKRKKKKKKEEKGKIGILGNKSILKLFKKKILKKKKSQIKSKKDTKSLCFRARIFKMPEILELKKYLKNI